MTLIYLAVLCLVVAQIVGIYGLKTRKADILLSVLMIGLLAVGLALGVTGALHQLK